MLCALRLLFISVPKCLTLSWLSTTDQASGGIMCNLHNTWKKNSLNHVLEHSCLKRDFCTYSSCRRYIFHCYPCNLCWSFVKSTIKPSWSSMVPYQPNQWQGRHCKDHNTSVFTFFLKEGANLLSPYTFNVINGIPIYHIAECHCHLKNLKSVTLI